MEHRPEKSDGQALRIGAVAKLAGLPESTISQWESVHKVVRSAWTSQGERVYSAADVERLILLRIAVNQGNAIANVARHSNVELCDLVLLGSTSKAGSAGDFRMAVVGPLLAAQLEPVLQNLLQIRCAGTFATLAELLKSPQRETFDLVLVDQPNLQLEQISALLGTLQDLRPRLLAVVYTLAGVHDLWKLDQNRVLRIQRPLEPEAVVRTCLVRLVQDLRGKRD
ncbi:MAG: MerR family transcriptional regulator [Nevskia sp.]|nr:MerR family transcriptional regulator [Nevskia sp.]